MIARTIAGLALACCCAGAEDLVVLRDGIRLVGEVQSEDARHVVLRIERGRLVTLDRVQVSEVLRGHGRGEVPRPLELEPVLERPKDGPRRADSPVAAAPLSPWTISLVVTVGWADDSTKSSGTVTDVPAANTFALSGDYDLGGSQLPAGTVLRLTHDASPGGSGLRLGLQSGFDYASGDDATSTLLQVAAVAGWSWGDGRRRHAIQGLLGYESGTLDRELVLLDGSGSTLAELDDSADLSGWSLALEAETTWSSGRWVFGLVGGLSWRSLSGDAAWSAASGRFIGSEELDSTGLVAYAGGLIGCRL